MTRDKNFRRKQLPINAEDSRRLDGDEGALARSLLSAGEVFARIEPTLAVSLTGAAYTQNFDSLPSVGSGYTTLPADWTFTESGSLANSLYSTGSGTSATGDTYSFGVAGTNAVTERALGNLGSNNMVPIFGASFSNATGSTISGLLISYVGELWRLGDNSGRLDRLDFQYSLNATSLTTGTWTDADQLDFSTPNTTGSVGAADSARDGNAASFRTAISSNITGLAIASGATFWIRWNAFDAAGLEDGLAIDNFSLSTPGALGIGDLSMAEGNSGTTNFTFTVSRTGGSSGAVGATWTLTLSGDATSADFNPGAQSGTVSFANGETSKQIVVTVQGDTTFESDETFIVTLSAPTGGVMLGDSTGQGTIINDDAALSPPAVDLDGTSDSNSFSGVFTEGPTGAPIGNSIQVFQGSLPITGATVTIVAPVDGDLLEVLGTLPGTIVTGPGTTATTLVLTGSGTAAQWAAALGAIVYRSSSDNPTFHGTDTGRQINVSVSGALQTSATATANITVIGINDAPVVAGLDGEAVTFTEGDSYVVLDDAIPIAAVADPDNWNFDGGFIQIGVMANPKDEDEFFVLGVVDVGIVEDKVFVDGAQIGKITGRGPGEILTISLNDEATPERVATLLGQLAYRNVAGEAPSPGTRSVTWLLDDGGGGIDTGVLSVTVVATEDPGIIGGDTSGAVTEDATLSAGGTLTVSDPDDPDTFVTATIAGIYGSFAILADGNWSYVLDNASAQGLNGGVSAGQSFQVFTTGGESAFVSITVHGTNDPATIDGDDDGIVTEDGTLAASGTLTVSDVDTGENGFVRQDAAVTTYGTFTLEADGDWSYQLDNAHPALPGLDGGETLTDAIEVKSLDGTTHLVIITINGADDGPKGMDDRLSVDEDAPHVFAAADFPFTDTEGNQLLNVIITGFTGNGTLSYDGTPVTTFPIIVGATDLANGLLVFTPAQDENGDNYAALQFRVQDDGGTADTDPAANTLAIDIIALNDAPTVAIAPAGTATEQIPLDLKNRIMIADVDAGLCTIIVTISVDYGIVNANAGGSGVIVGNNGASAVMLTGTLAQIQALLSSDPTSTITYTAHTDNPPASAQLTISVNDGGNSGKDPGLSGDGDHEVGSAVQTIAITPVNDKPAIDLNGIGSGVDNAAAYIENAAPAILAGTMIVSDPEDAALEGATVTIGAGHEAGLDRLTIGGVASGTTVGGISFSFVSGVMTLTGMASRADYQAALRIVAFDSTSNTPPTSKSISWTVYDGALSSDAATTTINVIPVNDAPTLSGLANDLAQFIEGAAPVLLDHPSALADINDPDSPDFGGGSLTVAIGAGGVAAEDVLSLAFSGSLSGGDGIVNFGGRQFATFAGGSDGTPLVFTFDDDASQATVEALIGAVQYSNANTLNPSAGTRTVTWTLVDGDGTPNSGADTLVVTSFIGVNGVNDAPSGQDKTFSAFEDIGLTLFADDFGFSDVDGHSFAGVTISELPSGGTLVLAGNPIAVADAFVTKTQLDNGDLVFQPSPDGSGAAFARFKFQVVDEGGTLDGGEDNDPSPNTITFDVVAVNDAPVNSVPGDQILGEDGSLTFNAANGNLISIGDVDASGTSLTVTLTIADGALTLSQTAGLIVGGNGSGNVQLTGTLAAINAALDGLTYEPADNLSGDRTLIVTTNDNGDSGLDPGLTGGSSYEQDQDGIAITIRSLNDAPEGTSNAVTINEDTTLVLAQAMFGFSDPVEDDDLAGILITTIPAPGTLRLDGVAVIAGQFVSAADIALGKLIFRPAADADGMPLTSFTFQVRDDGGTDDGGQDTDQSANALTINVTALNDAPVNSLPVPQAVNEDAFVTLSTATGNELQVADVDATTLTVTLSAAHGTLTLASTSDLSFDVGDGIDDASMTFSGMAAAINAALGSGLSYNPAAHYNGADAISVVTTDNGQAGIGGALTDSDSIAFTVHAVNDTPLNGMPGDQDVNEDAGVTLSAVNGNGLNVADVDATTLTVTLSVAHGTLTLVSTAELIFNGGSNGIDDATMTFSGTVDAINAALGSGLIYNPTADYHGSDAISMVTSDDGQTGPGGILTDTDSIAIAVNSVNDAPFGGDKAITLDEDVAYILAVADFGFSDPIDGDAFAGILVNGVPVEGVLRLNGVAVVSGQTISATDIGNGLLVFRPDLDESGALYAELNFQVQDNGGDANGGVFFGQSSNRIAFSVTPVNDAPVLDLNGADPGIDASTSYIEDGPGVAIGAGITVGDPDSGLGDRIESATIMLTDAVAGDTLTILGPLPDGIAAATVTPAGQIVMTLSGVASQADYATAIGQIRYATTDQNPAFGGAAPARTITVMINDGDASSAVATSTMTIVALNDAPVAQPDSFATDEATALAGDLFASNGSGTDGDVDGPALAVSAVNGSGANVGAQIVLASGALLKVNADGTFTYDPNHAFDTIPAPGSGASNTPAQDSFTYALAGGNTVTVTLIISGLDTDDILLGTAATDSLTAGQGNDLLNGAGGADMMAGGAGADTYVVDTVGDRIVEASAGGTDAVYALVSYVLTAGAEVEVLSAFGQAGTGAMDLVGNAFAQTVIGNAGANLLNGAGGADVLYGLGGDDTYVVDNPGDQIVEASGGGNDAVYAAVSYVLTAGAEVEVLSAFGQARTGALDLTGNAFAQTVIGNAGANLLNGGGGADVLYGLGGDDTYVVDNVGDQIVELAGGGNDAVYALASYVLTAGSEVEVLSAFGQARTGALDLTGNALAQTVIGNAGANLLNGGGGSDVLYGLGGNDTYVVDDLGDQVVEGAGGGSDAVYAVGSYVLSVGAEVEVLSAFGQGLTGAMDLTGNALAQALIGNAGMNVLDGAAGADVLYGLGGNDTFAFRTALGGGNADLIADFVAGADRIALDNAVFVGLALGAVNPNAFVRGTAAADADDRIIYNQTTGNLSFDADGNGAGAAVQFATLAGAPALTAADFTVI